eukprot:CAMPEP_0198252330 /NCGR_PEP_ID=MMETSP1447-20131203/2829_1 /TAXON_ID=420782 /ORGANISM="Chaetoceros dichaeta, Strain CCMP1751" /LENGTH=386 /DNA_ID=CAMNT_0043937523 /DNA_START=30 /DNA_END=1190 /DNA_ORIENTATION=+
MAKLIAQLCVIGVTISVSCALQLAPSFSIVKDNASCMQQKIKLKGSLFQTTRSHDGEEDGVLNSDANLLGAPSSSTTAQLFDSMVMNRYACTRFHRHEESSATTTSTAADLTNKSSPTASKSNPEIVNKAIHCLDMARRAPSGFNAQPYKFLVVHTPLKKELLAKYCLGRNADRVRDSDCTVLFLADRESARDWKRFSSFLKKSPLGRKRSKAIDKSEKKASWATKKLQLLLLLFSSGWPLPRILAAPLSFGVRLGVSIVSVLSRRRVLVPSLGSSETWSSKNTMLVAMTYLLGCTSREMATCPMEGYNIGGIRKVLGIPRRYAIPIIVSTGAAFKGEEEGIDDVGMAHGAPGGSSLPGTERYPFEEVVFGDEGFGETASYLQLSK